MTSDLELLRRYEPVVCYTLGELYFPCAVEQYVERSSLWLRQPNGESVQLKDWGELNLENLADYREIPDGHSLYLRFVRQPMDMLQYGRWRLRPDRPAFFAKGRLARVGIFSRITDSLFDLSLLIRGTVPGGTTAAADEMYQQIRREDPRQIYYGRVLRVGGYTILHYLFFYAMNDWRSSFYGINDHESDWEQIFVYLSGQGDELEPRWVAYASHEYEGDDLRRRWDDPELQIVEGTHPVVYAGAGSHASYFLPGEYMMNVEPPLLRPVRNILDSLLEFWSSTLGQGAERSEEDLHQTASSFVSIPFVDYARGDGVRIGPGYWRNWTPILIDDSIDWVDHYRGLWGLETSDPFGGERAPAGPKYNRDGSVRKSWYDPLGWAGLDKVTPQEELEPELIDQIERLLQRGQELDTEIRRQREKLRDLSLEVAALQQSEYVSAIESQQRQKLDDEEQALNELYAERMSTMETRKAAESYLEKIRDGDFGDPKAHIEHQQRPEPPVTHLTSAAEVWSAVSGGLLLLSIGAVITVMPSHWIWWLIAITFFFFALEAAVRGFLSKYVLNVCVFLALVSSFLLLIKYWWLAIIGAISALVIYMIRENLLELRYNRAVARGIRTDLPKSSGEAGRRSSERSGPLANRRES